MGRGLDIPLKVKYALRKVGFTSSKLYVKPLFLKAESRDGMKHRVKELRSNMGWTQDQLSERLGVSRQTVISIENGRYNPSLELAYKIAKTFRCSIEDVFLFESEGGE